MKKNIIITIVLAIVVIAAILIVNKKNEYKQPDITEVPSRNDTATIPESSASTTKVYTIAEVNMHDKATDCWIVIGDKVIDATSFIASGKHPNDKILNGCGKDATEMFKSVKKHSGPQAQETITNRCVRIVLWKIYFMK